MTLMLLLDMDDRSVVVQMLSPEAANMCSPSSWMPCRIVFWQCIY